ncbi:MAG: Hsp20/alpha crystallin family protein [bacterium]
MAEKTIATTTAPAAEEEKKIPGTRENTRQEERYLAPPVDIYETQEGLTVVADLPGVDKDGIDIRVDDNILTIQGKTKHSAPGNPVSTEYRLLHFYRQFQLGEGVDQEKITAQTRHGVLTIQLPRVEKQKPKKISVNVS